MGLNCSKHDTMSHVFLCLKKMYQLNKIEENPSILSETVKKRFYFCCCCYTVTKVKRVGIELFLCFFHPLISLAPLVFKSKLMNKFHQRNLPTQFILLSGKLSLCTQFNLWGRCARGRFHGLSFENGLSIHRIVFIG